MQLEDCKNFRQWKSQTPGHPENFVTEGIEVTTGMEALAVPGQKSFGQWCRELTAEAPLMQAQEWFCLSAGPLGQGIANSVGLAAAEAHLAARFNKDDAKVVDHYT